MNNHFEGLILFTIAVLPLADMSAGGDNEYFSDGLTETLLHMLAQMPELAVTARTSTFAFKGRLDDIRMCIACNQGCIARMGLGYLYLQQGKVSQANDELAESVRLLPVTENLFLLAEAREKGGDVEGGLSLYRLIVDKDPHSTLGRTAARRLAHAKGVQ